MPPCRPSRARLGLPLAAAVLLAAAAACARPAQLSIGQGWAWVREYFPPSGERDVETIVWSNAPPQVDLDTLQVWSVRRPWPLREWSWVRPPTSRPGDDLPVVWSPSGTPTPEPAKDHLAIHLATPLSHRMGHSLAYRLPGLGWTASYRVVVRGIGPESIQSVQVDVSASVRIRNETPTAFPDANVSLVGADPSLLPSRKPFGRLDLNLESPLSSLWMDLRDPIPLLPNHYPLQTPASLPAHGEAVVQFASVRRKPASIVHLCDSDDVPAPTPRGGLPLRRLLLVPNLAEIGLGFPLPPGEALIFLGSARGAPRQSGHVSHTPHPGTLRISMGATDEVLASRQLGPEIPLAEGAWQSDHSVTLINRLSSPARVHVVERPSSPMRWNLVRSSFPAQVFSDSILFDVSVPAAAALTVDYRLRLVSQAQ